MMTAKLVFGRGEHGYWLSQDLPGGRRWVIEINDAGRFMVGCDRFTQIDDAVAWCQSQEDAAAPVESPQPGDVYEVPGRKETRRLVHWASGDCVCHTPTGDETKTRDIRDWHSWVRESGAVRIDDGAEERLADARAMCEVALVKLATAEAELELARGWKAPAEAWEKRAMEAEAEVARLRAAIKAAGFSVMQTRGEWSIHDVSEQGKAEETKSMEVATRNVELEIERDDLKKKVAEAEKRGDDFLTLIFQMYTATGKQSGSGDELDAVKSLREERDCLQLACNMHEAANARLLEALREIQSDADAALSGVAFVVKLTSMRDRAREAIQREEGVNRDIIDKAEGIADCEPCEHQWTGKQLGGAPDMAESTEWVCYCKICGAEHPGDE